MQKELRILILEDFMDDVELIEHQLKKGDFSYTSMVVETRDQYEKELSEFKPDVVISDHSLPMFDSKLALQMFHSYRKIFNPAATFILVTGTVSEEFAVEIMKEGADDYILKDRLARLPAAIKNAMEKNQLRDQRRREEEEKLYMFDILQRSLHEIYVLNPQTLKFEYANQQALTNLGYSMEEMVQLTPEYTIEGFDHNRFRESVMHAEKLSKGLIVERKALRKNGTTYPIQVHLQVIRQGGEKKVLGNVLDITEAKEQEEQEKLGIFIQSSFSHQRTLKESLQIVLEKLCQSSSVAAEIYSREFDQHDSKILASFHPDRGGVTFSGSALAKKVYETGKVEILSGARDFKEEDKEWVAQVSVRGAVGIPITLGEEIVAVLICFSREVDSVKKKIRMFSDKVQQKLGGNIKRKRSEEELQKIFELSPDILAVIGKDGYVRKINPAWERNLGYNAEEMLSRSFEELIHPDDLDVLEEWRSTKLKENEIAHYESRWLTRNGEYKCFSWLVTPYIQGELQFAVGRDITQAKEQLEAIRQQNQKLAEIAWEQSHVVRAPLTRLLACVDYLEESGNEFNEVLSSVKRSAYEIDEVIKEIVQKSEQVEMNGKS